jgi:membrane-associated phospholipid phosphatase
MLILNDGFKSFPSGHSSCTWSRLSQGILPVADHERCICRVVSFAGLGFLAFYLAGKLHLADGRAQRVSSCAEWTGINGKF